MCAWSHTDTHSKHTMSNAVNGSAESFGIAGDADGHVSFNGSWSGKKLLESIEHDSTLHMSPEEFQVRNGFWF